jgi:hypothetical protein
VPNNKLSIIVSLEKKNPPFGGSVGHYVANKPYHINNRIYYAAKL